TAASEPYVLHFRVPVEQKISARSVLVLAHARLHDRRVAQGRESPRHVFPHRLGHLWRNDSRLRVGVHALAVLVESNLQSPAFDVRHPVDDILLEPPQRQRRRGTSHLASRYADKETLPPRRENPCPERVRENLAQPCSTGENKLPCGDAVALLRGDVLHITRFSRTCSLPGVILHAAPNRIFHRGCYRPPRHQHAAVWLDDPFLDFLQGDLCITPF